jgi:hypothetical protein
LTAGSCAPPQCAISSPAVSGERRVVAAHGCRHAADAAVALEKQPPAQLGEPFLPLLLALLYGGADLGAAVSNGARAASAAG